MYLRREGTLQAKSPAYQESWNLGPAGLTHLGGRTHVVCRGASGSPGHSSDCFWEGMARQGQCWPARGLDVPPLCTHSRVPSSQQPRRHERAAGEQALHGLCCGNYRSNCARLNVLIFTQMSVTWEPQHISRGMEMNGINFQVRAHDMSFP